MLPFRCVGIVLGSTYHIGIEDWGRPTRGPEGTHEILDWFNRATSELTALDWLKWPQPGRTRNSLFSTTTASSCEENHTLWITPHHEVYSWRVPLLGTRNQMPPFLLAPWPKATPFLTYKSSGTRTIFPQWRPCLSMKVEIIRHVNLRLRFKVYGFV